MNRNIKSKEFVFQFTQRYHDILGTRQGLNHPRGGQTTSEADAHELYRRLFGLMYDEFYAYQHGFLDPGIFAEWMKWGRDDYKGDKYKFEVAGIPYDQAWNRWGKIGPLAQHNFGRFLDEIHGCSSYADVERIVKENAPGFLGTLVTGQTVLRRTVFLSRLMGLALVAFAITMFINMASVIAIETAIVDNDALLRAAGLVLLIVGLAIVLGHNLWRGGLLALVVTILGWLTVLRGLFALWAPHDLVARLVEKSRYEEWFFWYAGVVLVVGAYLAIFGFLRSAKVPGRDGYGAVATAPPSAQTPAKPQPPTGLPSTAPKEPPEAV